ncbi:LysR family transcriptional regulator [Brevibacterium daeguense]|uniref:LysR family transcriptional regulator n=1 Tax=Brevibacterium daeguense TaxID=909936 RepID=A0ABP8EI05_9MICO|nr:LysR family transcriptional regulator [Brevibacterium daeguense]
MPNVPTSPTAPAPDAPASAAGQVSPEDLLTLLAVARLGKYTAAAHSLGINHTTVSRRIAALENSIGDRVLHSASEGWELTARGRELLSVAEDIEAALSRVYPAPAGSGRLTGMVRVAAPEGFCLTWAAPALTELQKRHPGLQVELIASTQRARQYRSGVDIEIMPGRPNVSRSLAYRLNDYSLGLFATAEYLARHGTPSSEEELPRHRIVYYIEHLHGIDSLDTAGRRLPEAPQGFLRSNSMLIHVRAARAGAGIGLIPTYLGETHPELVRVLPQLDHRITYWASVRKEALRNRGVRAALEVLREFCSLPPETPVAPGR